ncbi:MAG: sulfatase, partial [Planctomycetota bacterium]
MAGGAMETAARAAHRAGARAAAVVGWLAASAVVAAGLLLATASWMTFRTVGTPLDVEALRFIAADVTLVLAHARHMAPVGFLAVPLAAVLAALALTHLLPRLLARLDARVQRRLRGAAAVLVVACGLAAAAGHLAWRTADARIHDGATGARYPLGDLYALARDERSGPWLALAADLRELVRPRDDLLPDLEGIEVVRRPLVTLDAYRAGADVDAMNRWNVIVVIVESLRPDQIPAFGGARDVMPTVQRLTAEGLVFTNARTQSSHSSYADPCPLSSHYPLRSGWTHYYPPDPTYPRVPLHDILKALGYRTAIVSSQNENWAGMLNYLRTDGLDHVLHSETYDGPTYVPRHDRVFTAWVQGEKRSGKIDDRFTIDEAIRWIDEAPDEPFFCYINLQNSHVPFVIPADFERRFSPPDTDVPIMLGWFPEDQVDLVRDVYADSLAYVDAQLARLVAHLERIGGWDRTLVVVTGDTGQAFYEHGFASHAGPLYDEVMHVPLVIRAPGLAATVDDRPVQHVDVPPTVLHLLGLPPHPSAQGVSLLDPATR